MTESSRRQVRLEVPWRTLFKVLAALAIAWCIVQLVPIVLMLVVAVVLAVSLDPIVNWLEHHRVQRTAAAVIVAAAIVLIVGVFVWLTWSSLASQWQLVAGEVERTAIQLWDSMPGWLRSALGSQQGSGESPADGFAVRIFSSTTSAIGYVVLGFVLAIERIKLRN